MRQNLTTEDEKFLVIRTLSINYSSGDGEGIHGHDWAQLLYAGSGAIRAIVDNKVWIVPPRRALWIPAGLTHALNMLGPVELRTLYCSPVLGFASRQVCVLDICPLLHEAIIRSCALQCLDSREPAQERLVGLIIDEIATASSTAMFLQLPRDPRAKRLADRFMEEGTANVELESLLADIGLSRRTVERLFQAETGLAPARWRRILLLSRSLELLARGSSIDEVFPAAGYGTRSAFTEAFSKTFGFSPGNIGKH